MSSLPMRGAWIEMMIATSLGTGSVCRSPCGGRGLKYDAACSEFDCRIVAPHAGGRGLKYRCPRDICG